MADYRRGLVPLIATVVGTLLAARLGFWQLDRAAQKVALQTALESRSRLPALAAGALARTAAAAEPQHYRLAVVSGRWIAERTLFLDNRQMDGRAGFFVVTPLQIQGTSEAVLVERGWVARNFNDRAALPPVATPAGTVTVAGRVTPPPSRLFEFAGAASGPIRQNLDIPAYARETGLTLLPLSILQLDSSGAGATSSPGRSADGLARHWPAPAIDVQKHYGYAAQWFAIAVGIAFLYVWHRIIRPRARRA
ncbi:MAG: SURF1 family protein [Caldimonas sp.]